MRPRWANSYDWTASSEDAEADMLRLLGIGPAQEHALLALGFELARPLHTRQTHVAVRSIGDVDSRGIWLDSRILYELRLDELILSLRCGWCFGPLDCSNHVEEIAFGEKTVKRRSCEKCYRTHAPTPREMWPNYGAKLGQLNPYEQRRARPIAPVASA